MIGSRAPNATLAKALGQDELDDFVIPILRSCLVHDDAQTEKLLDVVKQSLSLNAIKKVSPFPLSEYLEEKKRDKNNSGWLLRLISGRTSNISTTKPPSQSETIVKSVLLYLLKGHCKSNEILPFACGTSSQKEMQRLKEKSTAFLCSCLEGNASSGNKSEDTSVAGTRITMPLSPTTTTTRASSSLSIATDKTASLQVEPTGLVVKSTGANKVLSPITMKNSELTNFPSASRSGDTSVNSSFGSPSPKRMCSKSTPAPCSDSMSFSTPLSSNTNIPQRQRNHFDFTEGEETDGLCTTLSFSAEEEGNKNENLDQWTVRVNVSEPREARFGGGGEVGFNASGQTDVKLYVGNLSLDTTDISIRDAFAVYGTVRDVFLSTDRENRCHCGYAFVTMIAAEAEHVMNGMNESNLDGWNIRIIEDENTSIHHASEEDGNEEGNESTSNQLSPRVQAFIHNIQNADSDAKVISEIFIFFNNKAMEMELFRISIIWQFEFQSQDS